MHVRFVSAVLAAAAVTGALAAAPAQASPGHDQAPHIRIAAVQYDSPGPDDRSNRSLNGEWVKVVNDGRRAVNLRGWTLSDEDGHTYHFRQLRLGAREAVRVHTGRGYDTGRNVYQDRRAYVWNNRHDTAYLRDARGHLVDTESWGRHHR